MSDADAVLVLFERMLGSGGVIAYHDVTEVPFLPAIHITARVLAEQIELLATRYEPIPLSELITRRRANRPLKGCVAVTFDDAYRGVLDLALPVLRRHGVPATVFVTTGYAQTGGRYWWDRLGWVLERGDVVTREGVLRATGIPSARQDDILASVIARSAGCLSADVEVAVARAEQSLGVVPERALSEAELQILSRTELIEFGCHTESHPALPALHGDAQRREIERSYVWLAERLPRVRRLLAYPYGLYDQTTIGAARAAGMDAAFSFEGRAPGPWFGLYTCPRIGMSDVYDLRSLRLRLNWFAIPFIAWRNQGWHPRMPIAAPA
jgi:peptidoglycan/xylan/chitin deacetylase (PgdA/CDA1 family)